MFSMKIGIIGLGNVGCAVLKELKRRGANAIGFDKDSCMVRKMRPYGAMEKLLSCDVYLICVYSTDDVLDALLTPSNWPRRPRQLLNAPRNPVVHARDVQLVVA